MVYKKIDFNQFSEVESLLIFIYVVWGLVNFVSKYEMLEMEMLLAIVYNFIYDELGLDGNF